MTRAFRDTNKHASGEKGEKMNHADGPRARLLLLFSILFLPSVKPFTAGGGPAALSWARAAPALRAGSVEEKQQLQEQDEEVSRLKEAVSQLAAGKLSKSQFEKIVREEEEAAAIRFEERILAKAEADAVTTAKLTTASAAGLGTVGLAVGGFLDGVFADGAAPWAGPVGAVILGTAAYAAAAQDGSVAASFRSVAGGGTMSVLDAAKGAAVEAVDGAKSSVAKKVEATAAKDGPGKAIDAIKEEVDLTGAEGAAGKVAEGALTEFQRLLGAAMRGVKGRFELPSPPSATSPTPKFSIPPFDLESIAKLAPKAPAMPAEEETPKPTAKSPARFSAPLFTSPAAGPRRVVSPKVAPQAAAEDLPRWRRTRPTRGKADGQEVVEDPPEEPPGFLSLSFDLFGSYKVASNDVMNESPAEIAEITTAVPEDKKGFVRLSKKKIQKGR